MYAIVENVNFDGEDSLMVLAAFDDLAEAKAVWEEAGNEDYKIVQFNAENGLDFI